MRASQREESLDARSALIEKYKICGSVLSLCEESLDARRAWIEKYKICGPVLSLCIFFVGRTSGFSLTIDHPLLFGATRTSTILFPVTVRGR